MVSLPSEGRGLESLLSWFWSLSHPAKVALLGAIVPFVVGLYREQQAEGVLGVVNSPPASVGPDYVVVGFGLLAAVFGLVAIVSWRNSVEPSRTLFAGVVGAGIGSLHVLRAFLAA